MVQVKKNKSNYVAVTQEFIKDASLSWKAKGILMYLLSQPEDSRLNEIEVARYSTDGMSSFKSGIKELKDHGYLEIRIEKDKSGKFSSSRWILHENPELDGVMIGDN